MSALLISAALAACEPERNRLQRIKERNEIAVLASNGPTTYYEGPDGPTGFEYDIAAAFARHLGVRLRIETGGESDEMLRRVAAGDADVAAGITVSDERLAKMRFGPPYHEVRTHVVYRLGSSRPRDARDLIGRQIEIAANGDHVRRLQVLRKEYPGLSWKEVAEAEPEEMLVSVWQGLLDLTIADSDILALNRQYYPELQIAFDIDAPRQLAWAFAPDDDDSLYQAAVSFFSAFRERELARVLDRHYGPTRRFNYVNTARFLERINDTLPAYRDMFVRAGLKYGLDWRLLAAIGYQESYWDSGAVSRTGVRGIMMLTHETSAHLGISDREDPEQSIDGGARYLRALIDRMPPGVMQPDRTWMALAAYNVGHNHLRDARVLTKRLNGDPDKWHDVEARLPLLANAKFHKTLRHGYARGHEPVQFVHRIRSYYNILVKRDEEEKARNNPVILQLKAPAL